MKRYSSLIIALIAIIILGNILGINRWIARRSIPIAVYITVYPFPFNISGSFSEGYFQGAELGGQADKVLATLAARGHCKVAIADGFVDAKEFQFSNFEGNELVMRCKSGGVAWNEILVIKEGIVKEIRIAGGLWL